MSMAKGHFRMTSKASRALYRGFHVVIPGLRAMFARRTRDLLLDSSTANADSGSRSLRGLARNDDGHGWPRMVLRAVVVATGLGFGVLLAGCSSHGTPPPQSSTTPHNVTLTKAQQQSIHIITVAPSDYRTTITTTGVVDFDRNRATQVLAPFSGAVSKVLVTLGEKVKQGQPLAEVDSPDYASAIGAYRKAVLTASAADSIASNDRDLYAHQAISQRENAEAQASAAGADADRAAARQALVALHMDAKTIAAIRDGRSFAHGQGTIRAPISGTVVEKSIAPGQALGVGTTPCFTIADTAKMWVMARVYGADLQRVQTGDPAEIDLGDGGKPLAGTVTNVGAVVDPDTRSVAARIAINNTGDALKKGMFVEAQIHSRVARKGILVADSAVLRDDENLPFVYVVAKDGGYARRPVTLGTRVGNRYVIPDGLHAGDKVVVDGSIFLRFIQSQ